MKDKTTLNDQMDELIESSQSLLRKAVLEHRKVEEIKHMSVPIFWNQEELYEKKIIFTGIRQRELLNAYREVCIRLLQKNKTSNLVVMVSSVARIDSTRSFSFNLAATFAFDQYKTALFVDCNSYEADVERYLLEPITRGLSDYLSDTTIPLESIIYPCGIERVRVIPFGTSSESAAENFNSRKMQAFIAEIKQRYPDRFIVLDAPSVQQSPEARILSRHCDCTVLSVPFGKAVTDEVLAAIDVVGKEKFAGLVFNN